MSFLIVTIDQMVRQMKPADTHKQYQ